MPLWIYLLAPLVGAAVGALAYQLARGEAPRPAAFDGERGRGSRVA